ncbi:MAG: hypothetical protein V7634_624, partial [Bradyrhizobium sp.]
MRAVLACVIAVCAPVLSLCALT